MDNLENFLSAIRRGRLSLRPRSLGRYAVALLPLIGACGHQGNVAAAITGPTYYFSDCQSGAHSSCVAGQNSASGTNPASPKRDLAGVRVNELPAGTKLLFAQGGSWVNFNVFLSNPRATEASPLVFDSYKPQWGGAAKPAFRTVAGHNAFAIGGVYNNAVVDGGYTIRNIKLVGDPGSESGVWVHSQTRGVVLENLEITGFKIGVHSQNMGVNGNTNLVLRDSYLHGNTDIGYLGDANGLIIERNRFEANSSAGTSRHHALYLSGKGRDGVIRDNMFLGNSVSGGVCRGGNVTVHGQWDNVLMERNIIEQQASAMSCYGFSINPGYSTAEWFRNFSLRNNKIINLGGCSICVTSAPGIVIEGNLIINNQIGYHAGIIVGGKVSSEDDKDTGAIVRGNSIYLERNAGDSEAIRVVGGSDVDVSSNLISVGSKGGGGRFCFQHGPRSDFRAFDGNLCYTGGTGNSWSRSYKTLASAKSAGFDLGGSADDPMFVETPSKENGWRCAVHPTSPAVKLKVEAGATQLCAR